MLRPELTALPPRIARLPVEDRGYPVPFFAVWIAQCSGCSTPTRDKEQDHPGVCTCGGYITDKPDFRVADPKKWARAVQNRLCWICGEPLGAYLVFPIGPMCGISRTTPEPPSHRECVEWSLRNCPFLARPHMHRRQDEFTETMSTPGFMIDRNPGVTLLWVTKSYKVFKAHEGGAGYLIEVGDPVETHWFAEGRPATRAEVEASVNSGLPNLEAVCAQDTDPAASRRTLQQYHARLVQLYPVA